MSLVILLIVGVIFGPPLVLFIVGRGKSKTKPETAKIFYVLAVVYLLVAGGTCYSLLAA